LLQQAKLFSFSNLTLASELANSTTRFESVPLNLKCSVTSIADLSLARNANFEISSQKIDFVDFKRTNLTKRLQKDFGFAQVVEAE